MPKTLEDVLASLKRKAKNTSPEALATFNALDAYFSQLAKRSAAAVQSRDNPRKTKSTKPKRRGNAK